MEALLAAKTKLVTDYLMLAQQMNHTANSMTNYVSALAGLPSHADTVQHLVPVPQLPPAEPFNEFLQDLKGKSSGSGRAVDMPKGAKVSVASAAGGDAEGPKKRGRKSTGVKKEKDPNAPKRPASAYIIFQNEMRPKLREAHPDLPYKDLLTKISEEWKAVPEDKKNVYNDSAKAAMEDWRTQNAAYQANKAEGVSPAATPAVEEDEEEEAAAPPKKKFRAQSDESSSAEDNSESSDDEPAPPPPVKSSSAGKKSAGSSAAASSSAKKSKKQK